jgi:uncharacterized membrane protein
MTGTPPPAHPSTGRLRLAVLTVTQVAAFLTLAALVVAAARRGDQPAAAGIGGTLFVVFAWLLWRQHKELGYVRKLQAADQQRIDAGGAQNMTTTQQAKWLDDLKDALS